MTYVKIGKHSGATIASAMKGTFLGIINEGKKTLVKLDKNYKIDNNRVYDIRITNGTAKITAVANAWACPKQTYDEIMRDGNDIINRMFGDLMG